MQPPQTSHTRICDMYRQATAARGARGNQWVTEAWVVCPAQRPAPARRAHDTGSAQCAFQQRPVGRPRRRASHSAKHGCAFIVIVRGGGRGWAAAGQESEENTAERRLGALSTSMHPGGPACLWRTPCRLRATERKSGGGLQLDGHALCAPQESRRRVRRLASHCALRLPGRYALSSNKLPHRDPAAACVLKEVSAADEPALHHNKLGYALGTAAAARRGRVG